MQPRSDSGPEVAAPAPTAPVVRAPGLSVSDESHADELAPKGPKELMIEVADRLIGERGLDNVSMRDVASVAGQRNNSAVQYHFGSRDGLITQILRRRIAAMDAERRRRLTEVDAQGLGTDMNTLVHVLFGPIVDLLRDSPEATHYARFLHRIGPVTGPEVPEVHLRTKSDDVVVRLIDAMSHLPRRVAFERIDLATQMFTGSLAVYEDRRDANNKVVNTEFEAVVSHLYDMVAASFRAGIGTGAPTAEGEVTAESEGGEAAGPEGAIEPSG